jgi:hypothetical protein
MAAQRISIRLTLPLAIATLAGSPTSVSPQVGSISGTVYDSIAGTPLEDAAVVLWDTPYRTATDGEGRFRLDDIPVGAYSILFFHTRLGELGVSAGPRTLTISEGSDEEIELATPSLPTLVRSQCLLDERPAGAGAVSGRVIDGGSAVPLGGAGVQLSWNEKGTALPRIIELNAASDGWYRSCAAPAGVPILVTAEYFGLRNARREVTVVGDGFTAADLALYPLRPSRITGRLIDGESNHGVEGAEAWLRGTAHRTLSDDGGNFTFGDVPPGTYMLVTDHLAYGTKMDTLEVPSGQRLRVEMHIDSRPIEIAPITVTAEASSGEASPRGGGGILISRQDIDKVRQRARDASDIIRSLNIPGVVVRQNSNGTICVGHTVGQVQMMDNGCVNMMLYINGVRTTDPNQALRLPPDAIDRMVVYKPLDAGNLFGLGGAHGVWLIYTNGN